MVNVPGGSDKETRDNIKSRLKKLKELFDEDLISEQEYDERKKKILDQT